MDESDALLLLMSWWQTPGHWRQKILIQLSLFYINVAQKKKTERLEKQKDTRSIFKTIEVLNDFLKLKSDFLCFSICFM